MNNKTLMISTDYLRDNTSITGNVDGNLLTPHIIVAQNIHIEGILGTALFNEVIGHINAGTIAGNIKVLLDDYIQPTLCQWAFYEAFPFINYSISNTGVNTKAGENDTDTALEEIQFLRGSIKDTAEYMSQRVINYLRANVSLYNSYTNPGSGLDTIRPNSSVYFSGIAFDGNDDDCGWGTGQHNTILN